MWESVMHQQYRSDFQCENPQKALDQRTVVHDFAFICEFSIWTRGVSHCGLAIYIKTYLKAKAELWKLKYISPCKNI
jgi:hypothetical protein